MIRFPPLKISSKVPSKSDAGRRHLGFQPDSILSVVWEKQRHSFVVEQKSSSTPRTLEAAIGQARRYADLSQGRYRPMVVLPYLSPEALERLLSTQVSGIDLSGNGVVLVPGKLFVYRTGEKNKFPAGTPIRNVYRGTTSLVARVFLARGAFSSVTEVRREITHRGGEISMSTVSKALRGLQEDLIVGRDESISLLQAPKLLDLLVSNYQGPNVVRRVRGRVEDMPSALELFATNTREYELSIAGSSPSRYVVMPDSEESTDIYTSSINDLLRGVAFRETNRFPNVTLLESRDQTVYFDRREENGFYWVSPLQAYLELASGGKREQQASQQIRPDLLRQNHEDR